METQKTITAVALAYCVASAVAARPEPQPFVQIADAEMPQFVREHLAEFKENKKSAKAIVIYHDLRKSFSISHKKMGDWLGVKRRSLYNWMDEPDKARKYGRQIEYRLAALVELKEDMEPEHLPLLEKIAFSPIYGDPQFGESILEGKSSNELIAWYDKMFSQFESYRRTLKRKRTTA